MIECREDIVASKATIMRLPMYLRYLREKHNQGVENISSTAIAEDMKLGPVQIRKDLSLISSVSGRPKLGFCVDELIKDIESFLGCHNVNDALLAGVGGLGSTLLSYEGFKNYGLNIVAAFDVKEELFGKRIAGVPILPVDKMPGAAKKLNIRMGIITAPKEAAQRLADIMVESGIKAIWNFAPTHIKLPDGVAVKNEDLAASLAVLSKKLADTVRSG